MGFREVIRQIVDGTIGREQDMWARFLVHTQNYEHALGLTEADVDVLERAQPNTGMFPSATDLASGAVLKFHVEGEDFVLLAKHICGVHYDKDANWRHCLMVICTSNEKLNESTGGGTIFLNVIREDWHRKVVGYLVEGDPWSS